MKIIYTTDFTRTTKSDLTMLDGLKEDGYRFTAVDWKEELDIDYTPSREEIDKLYSMHDEKLFDLYKKIRTLSKSQDVLLVTQTHVYHPKFIDSLDGIYKVFWSGDDPDSSEDCSKPYVTHYDHMFTVGVNFDKNTKITDKFLEWGAKRADWWPLGFRGDTYNPNLTVEDIYNKERDIDLAFIGNIVGRRHKLVKIKRAFPQMKLYSNDLRKLKIKLLANLYYSTMSRSWTWATELPHDQLSPFYQRVKIGINEHPISGPSTLRTYQLPSNGVMQICDCPEGLDQVFKVGKEVVAYHSIDEAIELIHYYLDNDEERKKIAAEGFKRAIKDYKRETTFLNALRKIENSIDVTN